MANKEPYVFKKRKQPIFAIVKFVLRIFLRKPKIINLNGDKLPDQCLYIGVHRGKWTPMYMKLYYPKDIVFVGAYPMLGKYKERNYYLREIFYIKKCHKKRFPSTLKSAFEAIFSKMVYKGLRLIPSYPDGRFINTIQNSTKTIDNGFSVVIFPEDSEDGYYDIITKAYPGFIGIAQGYNKTHDHELAIVPISAHVRKKVIVVDKPFYLSTLEGLNRDEICEFAKDRLNSLFTDYIEKL